MRLFGMAAATVCYVFGALLLFAGIGTAAAIAYYNVKYGLITPKSDAESLSNVAFSITNVVRSTLYFAGGVVAVFAAGK